MELESFSTRLSAQIEHALQSQICMHMTAMYTLMARVATTEISIKKQSRDKKLITPPKKNVFLATKNGQLHGLCQIEAKPNRKNNDRKGDTPLGWIEDG